MDYHVNNNEFELLIEEGKNQVKTQILEQYITLRKKNGMTQQEIADITGMQRTNIVRIESGKYVPTIEVLVKLAVALEMSLEVKLVAQDNNQGI